jgi:hypothetical protein
LIAAAVARDGSATPRTVSSQKSTLRLPDIATAIPLELLAGVEPANSRRALSTARNQPAATR